MKTDLKSYHGIESQPFNNDKEQVKRIIFNQFLLDKRSHFVVERTGIVEERAHAATHIEEVARINNAYRNEYKTIKIENLENFNEELSHLCDLFGEGTDLHMFISPVRGTAFPDHKDDRDVWIYCVYGNKRFYINGVPTILEAGDLLHIPKGTTHRAETDGPSCILSFGVWSGYDESDINYPAEFPL